ncbi:MAG: hypothetical protein AAFU78_20855 [Cyanobacteria bacterium J06633_2]
MIGAHKEVLKDFFKPQMPLGDIAALEAAGEESRKIFSSYFDAENEPYRELRRDPSMIIGRKGSGKTDALLSYRFAAGRHTARYEPVVFFEANGAAGVISAVVNQIGDIVEGNRPPPTVEAVSEFWTNLFWVCLVAKVVSTDRPWPKQEYEVLKRFTGSMFEAHELDEDPHRLIISTITKLRKDYALSDYKQASINFFSAHDQMPYGGITIRDAVVAAQSLLRKAKNPAIILFDSIEALDIAEVENKLVLSGLLKAVGAFQSLSKVAHFRCCVPAETYFSLLDLSSNVLKDFRDNHILHWHSSELLRICAKRYATFLEIYAPESLGEYVKPYNGFSDRSDVIRFWENLLPATVPNTKVDVRESTIPYITRHTQLLPRHFLLIFNRIISSAIQEGKSLSPSRISEEMVQESVARMESRIVDQVLDSYKRSWPSAKQALTAVLPGLNKNIVHYSELHKHFNQAGGERGVFQNISGFSDFLKMLSELGAIGRLTTSTNDYATATFEYGEPHRMLYTDKDTLCVHPIFTEMFRVIVPSSLPETYQPVYPLGTDPASADYRERW